MYNEELKNRFIREEINAEGTAENYISIFNTIEEHEKKWHADVCTRTAAELQPVIDELSGLRSKSGHVRSILLKRYINWCVKNNIENARDDINKTNPTSIERIKYFMVSCPKHLNKCLDEICDPIEENTIDCIYRCYYWLAYSGMSEEDIILVKVSDVDFESMSVRWNGKDFPIYREAIPAFKNAAKLTEFVYKHPNYPKPIIRNRCEGNTLIRGIRYLPTVASMRVELSRRQKGAVESGKTKMKLSYKRVWMSGMFYAAYENERAGISPDFASNAKEFAGDKEYKLDQCGNTQENKRKHLAEDYKTDYERWKKAFSCL